MSDNSKVDTSEIRRQSAVHALQERVEGADGEWQPIETAPKDGTVLLAAHEHAALTVWWAEGSDVDGGAGWVDGCRDNYEDLVVYPVTHWRPLPPLPARTEAGEPQ